ncbi:MAG: DUF6175 family protein [Tannerellaceae bacterium]|nr:DUF6175 family protein [Tannerellaceae bacterium]
MKKVIIHSIFPFCLLNPCVRASKKPSLMVVPGDVWCNQNGYTQVFDNQGLTEVIPDYKTALQNDKDLMNVISKINILMTERGFPLQDLSASIRNIQNMTAEDNLIMSKESGATIAESPLDKLRRTAKADIILEVDWTINTSGPKKSITYNLRGIDAYTNKQIAGAQGTGAPSFSAEVAVLLEEAILVNMDQFNNQLQAHFDDLFENGREIALDVRVFDNGSGIDLETEFNGYELTEIIDDWMAMNTVNHRYSKADATENYIMFNQVRIPLFRENGMPMDTEHFARNLMRFLRQAPYNLPCKIINRGLGRCLLIIGEK